MIFVKITRIIFKVLHQIIEGRGARAGFWPTSCTYIHTRYYSYILNLLFLNNIVFTYFCLQPSKLNDIVAWRLGAVV
jgi:hypothetical protein